MPQKLLYLQLFTVHPYKALCMQQSQSHALAANRTNLSRYVTTAEAVKHMHPLRQDPGHYHS